MLSRYEEKLLKEATGKSATLMLEAAEIILQQKREIETLKIENEILEKELEAALESEDEVLETIRDIADKYYDSMKRLAKR